VNDSNCWLQQYNARIYFHASVDQEYRVILPASNLISRASVDLGCVSYDPHSDSASLSCTRISLTAFQAGGLFRGGFISLFIREEGSVHIADKIQAGAIKHICSVSLMFLCYSIFVFALFCTIFCSVLGC